MKNALVSETEYKGILLAFRFSASVGLLKFFLSKLIPTVLGYSVYFVIIALNLIIVN